MSDNNQQYKSIMSNKELQTFLESSETLLIQDALIMAMTSPQQNRAETKDTISRNETENAATN